MSREAIDYANCVRRLVTMQTHKITILDIQAAHFLGNTSCLSWRDRQNKQITGTNNILRTFANTDREIAARIIETYAPSGSETRAQIADILGIGAKRRAAFIKVKTIAELEIYIERIAGSSR